MFPIKNEVGALAIFVPSNVCTWNHVPALSMIFWTDFSQPIPRIYRAVDFEEYSQPS